MIEYHKNFSLGSLPYINLEGLVCWEEFKDIPDYKGQYQVSDLGRIKSLKSNMIMKLNFNKYGYLYIVLRKDGNNKNLLVHRLVMYTFINISKLTVDHINLIKSDNRKSNLRYCTIRENSIYYINATKGYIGATYAKREGKWACKITLEGKEYWLGYYTTPDEASNMYLITEINFRLYGELPKYRDLKLTSKFKHIHFCKRDKRWIVKYCKKRIGAFRTEEEAKIALNCHIKNLEKMKRRKLETVINYLGVELLIHFEIDGQHIPATREYPAEYPEVEITKVFAGDVEISNILLEPQWNDIYELLNGKLEL